MFPKVRTFRIYSRTRREDFFSEVVAITIASAHLITCAGLVYYLIVLPVIPPGVFTRSLSTLNTRICPGPSSRQKNGSLNLGPEINTHHPNQLSRAGHGDLIHCADAVVNYFTRLVRQKVCCTDRDPKR